MCIYKPKPDLLTGLLCLKCLLNPLHYPILSLLSPLAKLTSIVAAFNGALYSCKLAGGETGKNNMEEENSSSSHCCLHGEAADLAVCPLPTLQIPFFLS